MAAQKKAKSAKAIDYIDLVLSSPAFEQNGFIPKQYTCDGIDINPPIHISGIPTEAKSLAIIVDDPDAPNGTFCHWLIWNIPITHTIIEKENRGAQGMNDFSHHQYNGPCPPAGIHRYDFKIYALDCMLEIPVNSVKLILENSMTGHILASGILQGRYGRQKR